MVVPVLLGSVRSERLGDRAAKWAVKQLEARGHEAVLIDAQALELPLLDKMWKEIKTDPPAKYVALHAKLAPLAELYARADGFCIVSAEYNHSIPPGLTNLIDYFLEEYFWRSVGNRVLFGEIVWRCACGDATARAAGGDRHVFDPVNPADSLD